MNDASTTRVADVLLSTARSSRVWIPIALLVLGSIVFWSLLLMKSPTASYGSRVPLYASWAGFAAVLAALGGVGWLRTCFPRRPIQMCRTCGYDMRGAPALKSACPECGDSLQQTASRAVHGKMRASVIALPGCSCLWAQWHAPHMRWSLDCSSHTARLFNVELLHSEQSDLMPKRSVRPSQETKVPQITALSRASLKISQSCGLRAHRSCRRRRQSRHCCR